MAKQPGSERRQHKRLQVASSLVKQSDFNAIDLSESGIQVSSSKKFRVGETINLELNLKTEDNSLSLDCRVMWCRPSQSVFTTDNLIGLRFIDINASNTLRLRRYIEYLQETQ